MASAAALAALLNAAACGSSDGKAASTTTSADTSIPSTTLPPPTEPVTTVAATTVPTTAPTTAPRVTTAPTTTRRATTTSVTMQPTTPTSPYCTTDPSGNTSCAIPGRPLRRWWRHMLLLPVVDGGGHGDDEARAEYASVASFGELALRLLAVGAPAGLVGACHEAALDEIRHAALCDELAGRERSSFGAIPGLVGHRLGGWRRTRRTQLRRLAVESFLDGWVNEGAAADQLRQRAAQATSVEDRDRLASMAEDEQRHADLARSIITWCFEQEPAAVGRALARVAPVTLAA